MDLRAVASAVFTLLFLRCASPPETGATGGVEVGEDCDAEQKCEAGAFCDQGEHFYSTLKCRESGTCVMTPESCSDDGPPICGCDGILYANACAAATAGVGTQGAIGCEPPMGEFGCELEFCDIATEYCRHEVGGGNGENFACRPLSCMDSNAGCDCLDPEKPCGDGLFAAESCSLSESGAVEVFCLGY